MYTMLNDGNSGNSTALQNQMAVSAYLLSKQMCIFIFHGRADVIATPSKHGTLAQHWTKT